MEIKFGKGEVTCKGTGAFYIILKFKGRILISTIGHNIKVKLLNKTITIRGNLDGRDLLLFKYFGEFQPLSARNSITKKKVNLTPTSLTYWGLDVGIWDDDTTLWGDKDITYTHIKKIKRKLL